MNLKACVKRNEAKARRIAREKEKIKKHIEDILLNSRIEYRNIPFNIVNLESDDNNENLIQVIVSYPCISIDECIVKDETFKEDDLNNIIHTYSLETQNEEWMKVEETAYICNLIRGKNGVISMKNKPVFVTNIHYAVTISNSKFEFDKEFKLSEIINDLDFMKRVKVYKDNATYNKQYEKYVKFLKQNLNIPNPVSSLEEFLPMNGQRIKVNNNIELEIMVGKSDTTLPVFCETDELLARFDEVKAISNKVIVHIIKIRTRETFKGEFDWITVDEEVELKNGITTKELIELLDIE